MFGDTGKIQIRRIRNIPADKSNILQHIKLYFKEFANKTTIHGLRHVVSEGRHPIERALWFIVTLTFLIFTIQIVYVSYRRFLSNPIMVSIQKNFREWNVSLPAMTFCIEHRMDNIQAEIFIRERWGNVTVEQMEYYKRFINSVMNISYSNLENFKEYQNDTSLESISADMENISVKMHVDVSYELAAYNPTMSLHVSPVLTEVGLCFSVGSLIAPLFLPRVNERVSIPPTEPFNCSIHNSRCGGNLQISDVSAKFAVHSAYEIIETNTRFLRAPSKTHVDAGYTCQQVVADPEIRNLGLNQRKCQFKETPYSYTACLMKCRMTLALQLCGCAPYFYSTIGIPVNKICNARGLACLADHSETLQKLSDKEGRRIPCSCFYPCNIVTYLPTVLKELSSPNMEATVISWDVIIYPVTQYRRQILYSFQDLLVSYGGIAAFFLGCSIMSGVEVVYYFSLRLVCMMLTRTVSCGTKKTACI